MWNFCLCNKCFESHDQNIINLISLTDENENSDENFDDDEDLQEPHDLNGDVTVDEDFIFSNNR